MIAIEAVDGGKDRAVIKSRVREHLVLRPAVAVVLPWPRKSPWPLCMVKDAGATSAFAATATVKGAAAAHSATSIARTPYFIPAPLLLRLAVDARLQWGRTCTGAAVYRSCVSTSAAVGPRPSSVWLGRHLIGARCWRLNGGRTSLTCSSRLCRVCPPLRAVPSPGMAWSAWEGTARRPAGDLVAVRGVDEVGKQHRRVGCA